MRLLALIAWLILAIPALAVDDLDRIMAQGVLKAGVCLTADPVGYRDSTGTPRGFDVDVAALLAKKLGVRRRDRLQPYRKHRAGEGDELLLPVPAHWPQAAGQA
jgi:ABC-type amino acid transport substrate-binding protein